MKRIYPVPLGENDSDFLNALNAFLNDYEFISGCSAVISLDDDGQPILLYEDYIPSIKQTKKPIQPKERIPEDMLHFDMLLRNETKINEENV